RCRREPSRVLSRPSGRAMGEAATCTLHPGEAVVGACQRCGDFVCRRCLPGRRLLCARCNPAGDVEKPDLGKAFQYVFQDPDWLSKLLMGGLWMLIGIPTSVFIVPIGMLPLIGYGVLVAKREREAPRRVLPEWGNYGELFSLGF